MNPGTLTAAQRAMESVAAILRGVAEVRGIGIAVLEGGFGVKVNLSRSVDKGVIPDDVDGVPIIVDVVSDIHSL